MSRGDHLAPRARPRGNQSAEDLRSSMERAWPLDKVGDDRFGDLIGRLKDARPGKGAADASH